MIRRLLATSSAFALALAQISPAAAAINAPILGPQLPQFSGPCGTATAGTATFNCNGLLGGSYPWTAQQAMKNVRVFDTSATADAPAGLETIVSGKLVQLGANIGDFGTVQTGLQSGFVRMDTRGGGVIPLYSFFGATTPNPSGGYPALMTLDPVLGLKLDTSIAPGPAENSLKLDTTANSQNRLSHVATMAAVAGWANTAFPVEVDGFSAPGDGGRHRMVFDSANLCGAGGHGAADGVTCVNSTVVATGSWNIDWSDVGDRASVALFGSFGAGNINVDPGAFQAALNTGKDVWVPTGKSGAYQLQAAAAYNQPTSAALTSNSTTLPFSSTTGIVVGQLVTGPSVAPSTTVTAVSTNASVTISAAVSASSGSPIPQASVFTFTNPSILTFKYANQKIVAQDSGGVLIQCYLPSTQGTTNPCLNTNMLSGLKIRNVGMYYPGVPDTTSTSDKAPYGPLIFAQYSTAMDFDDLILARANVDVDMRGNTGNSRFTNMKFSCFSQCWQVDGSLDSNIWSRSHGFPYYMTANQTTVSYANATCWDMGRMDDFDVSDSMCILALSFNFHNNNIPFAGGGPSGRISNFDSDTHNGIIMTAGSVQCSACGFSMVANGNYAIFQYGGTLDLAAPQFFINPGISNPAVTVGGSGGVNNYPRLTVKGGSSLYLGDATNASKNNLFAIGTASGNTSGELTLMGHEVQRPAGTSANPATGNVIINKGTNARLTAMGNRISDLGTGSGSNYFIFIQGDGVDRVIGNASPGWANSFPSSPSFGIYQWNGGSIPTSSN